MHSTIELYRFTYEQETDKLVTEVYSLKLLQVLQGKLCYALL